MVESPARSGAATHQREIARYTLTDHDRVVVDGLVAAAMREFPAADDEAFLAEATVLGHELPRPVRRFLNGARTGDVGVFGIHGYRLDKALGPTPQHWRRPRGTEQRPEEYLLVLYSSLLGDVYSVSVLQDGKLFNDVVPVRGQETAITAGSSEERLLWHTEEAGFDVRPDYQGFVCLRNPTAVPTSVACVEWLVLDEDVRAVLAEPRFRIKPWGDRVDRAERIAVLYGGEATPYLRLDPVFTTADDGDEEAARALVAISDAIEAALRPIDHRPGDFFFIDNWRAVHGRDAYRASYTGDDRWLKRIKVSRNLRTSRTLRDGTLGRLVYLEQLLSSA